VAVPPVKSKMAAGIELWNINQSETFSYAVQLQYPFVISGKVLPPRVNNSLEGGTVEWYRQIGSRTFMVSKSRISEDGGFNALLPPK
jgi:hypothetical protein